MMSSYIEKRHVHEDWVGASPTEPDEYTFHAMVGHEHELCPCLLHKWLGWAAWSHRNTPVNRRCH